ncbi:MAG: molybdopterin-guanine dinucleotide biosynthesis protein MobB, partial [Thermoplasmata archaeon]|nr:molybdopterin-guanine dinucleotide biosynthesis protein MobB [Thermoplasmata archaeon]
MIIVSLIGLKKCGKTTTAEALIKEFKSRGMKVGGVKWMVHSNFTIDTEGK